MIIDQGSLLHGMGMIFVKEFKEIAREETHGEGDRLFHEGDPSTYFYTLIEGSVRLGIGDSAREVYTLNSPGEIFGWSSLTGGESYTASATCTARTILWKISRDEFQILLDKHPKCGFLLYQKLAKMLGNRLIECYKIMHNK